MTKDNVLSTLQEAKEYADRAVDSAMRLKYKLVKHIHKQ